MRQFTADDDSSSVGGSAGTTSAPADGLGVLMIVSLGDGVIGAEPTVGGVAPGVGEIPGAGVLPVTGGTVGLARVGAIVLGAIVAGAGVRPVNKRVCDCRRQASERVSPSEPNWNEVHLFDSLSDASKCSYIEIL